MCKILWFLLQTCVSILYFSFKNKVNQWRMFLIQMCFFRTRNRDPSTPHLSQPLSSPPSDFGHSCNYSGWSPIPSCLWNHPYIFGKRQVLLWLVRPLILSSIPKVMYQLQCFPLPSASPTPSCPILCWLIWFTLLYSWQLPVLQDGFSGQWGRNGEAHHITHR